jgi:hypothetical protein
VLDVLADRPPICAAREGLVGRVTLRFPRVPSGFRGGTRQTPSAPVTGGDAWARSLCVDHG